jgi:CheY-like chemotaxis protein
LFETGIAGETALELSSRKTILIADDEPAIRGIVTRCLGSKFVIIEASDGEQALDKAYKHHPDLILLDIMMPAMDGYVVCSRLKSAETTRDIPIVMMTGLGFELNAKLSKSLGAEGYINKPFNARELREPIARLLKESWPKDWD